MTASLGAAVDRMFLKNQNQELHLSATNLAKKLFELLGNTE
jgi:hypothetical protein